MAETTAQAAQLGHRLSSLGAHLVLEGEGTHVRPGPEAAPEAGTVDLAMKRLLVVALVMVLVLTGIPLLVGMAGMQGCANCPPALAAAGQCLGVLAGVAAALALLLSGRVRSRSSRLRPWPCALPFDRPPQLV